MRDVTRVGTVLVVGGVLLASTAPAQQQPAPSQSFGISTGVVLNDNRGLDDPSQGNTTEAFTRFDFNVVFSDPLQSLQLSGDVHYDAVVLTNGAELTVAELTEVTRLTHQE